VMLYEMVSGHRPFDGRTKIDTLAAILEREPPPLGKYFEKKTDEINELQRIASKALRKECEERYQTAEELLDDLKRFKQKLEFEEELGRVSSSHADVRPPISDGLSRGSDAARPARGADAVGGREHSSVEIILGEVKRHRKWA